MGIFKNFKKYEKKSLSLRATAISIALLLMFSSIVILMNNASAVSNTIVINEVMFVPNTGDHDWMELYNKGSTTQDVRLSVICYVQGTDTYTATLPPYSWLQNMLSGYYLIVHFTSGTDTSWSNGIGHIYISGIDLGNTGTNGLAFCGAGTIDEVCWYPGSMSGFVNTASILQGNTIGRDKTSTDTDSVSDWEITCGKHVAYPTQGDQNLNNILINEVMYLPGSSNEEWVELYNKHKIDIDVDGWKVSDEDSNVYTIPNIPDFPSNNYIVIHYKSGTDETSFGQSQTNALHLYYGAVTYWSSANSIWGGDEGLDVYDIDGVNNDDVFDGSLGGVAWHENENGDGSSWYPYPIARTLAPPAPQVEAQELVVADIDGVNTCDITIFWEYTPGNDHLYWRAGPTAATLKNRPPNPYAIWTSTHIASQNSVSEISVAKIDADNDNDVVAVSHSNGAIKWYENVNSGATWNANTISSNKGGYGLDVANIDGLGKNDVITTRYNSNTNTEDIIVWENNVGQPIPWVQHNIVSNQHYTWAVQVADIDGDTNLDIIATSAGTPLGGDAIYWYENPLPNNIWTTTWTKHTIATGILIRPIELDIGDVDNNGLLDIVTCSDYTGTTFTLDTVVWYEPTDPVIEITPSLAKWAKHAIDDSSNIKGCKNIRLSDIDNNNILDIVVTGDLLGSVWYDMGDNPTGIFQNVDQCSLYVSGTSGPSTIVDFVAWGADPGTDDSNAINANHKVWDDGDFVSTIGMIQAHTIGRDKDSTDTNQPADWDKTCGADATQPTQGSRNKYP